MKDHTTQAQNTRAFFIHYIQQPGHKVTNQNNIMQPKAMFVSLFYFVTYILTLIFKQVYDEL